MSAKKRKRGPKGQLILKERNGWFYVRGTLRGTPINKGLKTRSRDHAEFLKAEIEKSVLDGAVYGQKVVSTFSQCVAYYKKTTVSDAYHRFLKPLEEHFGDWKVKDITQADLVAFAEDKYQGWSLVSKNNAVFSPMIAVLRKAADGGLCDLPVLKRYKAQSPIVEGAPQEWIDEFLARCQKIKLRCLVALCTTTACRGIDAIRLEWRHVNLDEGRALLLTTKNGKPRELVLSPELCLMFRDLRQEEPDEVRVFAYTKSCTASREIYRECRRLGMKYYSMHKFGRHAFAERMLNQGYTLRETGHAGGWDDMTVLAKRYGHLEKGRMSQVVKNIGSQVLGGLKVIRGGKG